MVRPNCDAGAETQASYVRKVFDFVGDTTSARLRISALGLYRCFINGQRVGDDQLTPGWTSYWDRLSYQTYAVGDLLRQGKNTIDIWLGDGWYRSRLPFDKNSRTNMFGSEIGAIAELRAGGDLIVATDTTWHSGLLPILKSGIYFGEIYDATQEGLPADRGTSEIENFDRSVLIAHETNGVKELTALRPIGQFQDEAGRTIYDFGQNSGGYVALTVRGTRGSRVTIEHAEFVDNHGHFDRANLRSAEARAEYVLKGEGVESYRPMFTFFGFRYARVAIEGQAEIVSIASIPISTAITQTGQFKSASPLVNRLVENTIWSQRSNFIEVPTDCPQRDERLGWSGDAQVFAAAACYLHDSEGILRKWLRDLMADQRPDGAVPHFSPDPTRNNESTHPGSYGSTGWGDAICVVPWVLWEHYGDRSVLEETLPAMEKWVDFVWSISNGPIVRPPRAHSRRGFTFGDWLQPKGSTEKPLPTIGDDAAATIYLYISSVITAKAARVVGNAALADRMDARAKTVKEAFAREFVTPSGRLAYDDQTSYALAFVHDLIPDALVPAAKEYFKATIARAEGRIGTGFIGTPALLPALVKIGEPELATAVFLQEKVPGWLYQVKTGATTIWERWDAIREDGTAFAPAMNSYNHYAYGAVCQWLFEAVAGFRPDPVKPGFKHIIFEPTIIPELSPVSASHDSAAGRIEAAWTLEGDHVTYDVLVPEGASGTLLLPERSERCLLDGQFMTRPGGAGLHRATLAPGRHRITFKLESGRSTNKAS